MGEENCQKEDGPRGSEKGWARPAVSLLVGPTHQHLKRFFKKKMTREGEGRISSSSGPMTLNILQVDGRDGKSAETSPRSRKTVTPERGIKLHSRGWVSFLGTIAQNKAKRKRRRKKMLISLHEVASLSFLS